MKQSGITNTVQIFKTNNMQTNIYSIRLITNLHAGSGDSGYGVVDKLVQRDATTNLPTINASGIKGALREYFEKYLKCTWVPDVFGDDNDGKTGAKVGTYRFLSADVLCLPVPQNESPFYKLVYDAGHVKKINEKLKLLTQKDNPITGTGWEENAARFKEASDELTVIARNHLENGQSQNLWYEEAVPHQAAFVVAIQYPEGDKNIEEFNEKLDKTIIQVGGNATVGYGLCLFIKLHAS
jgi:CRISPR-associated protein Cmr4